MPSGRFSCERALNGQLVGGRSSRITSRKSAASSLSRCSIGACAGNSMTPALDVARLLGTGSGGNFDDGIATVERARIDAENASHAAHHFGALPFGQKNGSTRLPFLVAGEDLNL